MAVPTLLYSSETCVPTQNDLNKIQVGDTKFLRNYGFTILDKFNMYLKQRLKKELDTEPKSNNTYCWIQIKLKLTLDIYLVSFSQFIQV